MALSEQAVNEAIAKIGVKQLTAFDNTGLYCHSNHYSKKTKAILLAQQAKIVKKAKSRQ